MRQRREPAGRGRRTQLLGLAGRRGHGAARADTTVADTRAPTPSPHLRLAHTCAFPTPAPRLHRAPAPTPISLSGACRPWLDRVRRSGLLAGGRLIVADRNTDYSHGGCKGHLEWRHGQGDRNETQSDGTVLATRIEITKNDK
jgi:hypothetical protein